MSACCLKALNLEALCYATVYNIDYFLKNNVFHQSLKKEKEERERQRKEGKKTGSAARDF